MSGIKLIYLRFILEEHLDQLLTFVINSLLMICYNKIYKLQSLICLIIYYKIMNVHPEY